MDMASRYGVIHHENYEHTTLVEADYSELEKKVAVSLAPGERVVPKPSSETMDAIRMATEKAQAKINACKPYKWDGTTHTGHIHVPALNFPNLPNYKQAFKDAYEAVARNCPHELKQLKAK
jgi:hypothetical protein